MRPTDYPSELCLEALTVDEAAGACSVLPPADLRDAMADAAMLAAQQPHRSTIAIGGTFAAPPAAAQSVLLVPLPEVVHGWLGSGALVALYASVAAAGGSSLGGAPVQLALLESRRNASSGRYERSRVLRAQPAARPPGGTDAGGGSEVAIWAQLDASARYELALYRPPAAAAADATGGAAACQRVRAAIRIER